jgi:hypothetical protein
MSSLRDYLNKDFIKNLEEDMKVRRLMAPQDTVNEAEWNSVHDRWSRHAKHRLQVSEAIDMINNTWTKGDTAIYNETEVTIEIPQGPNNTVGILYEGNLKMVLETALTESVMGLMQPLNPLNRMMQLAGLSVTNICEPTHSDIESEHVLEEADATNMFQQLMKANLAGEYKNNPSAARLATVGQILIGLNTIIDDMKTKNEIPADIEPKLDTAVGLGAFLLQTSKKMTQL